MEPVQPVSSPHRVSLIKIIAALLFVILPFVGFWLGMEYQEIQSRNEEIQPALHSFRDENCHLYTACDLVTGESREFDSCGPLPPPTWTTVLNTCETALNSSCVWQDATNPQCFNNFGCCFEN